LRAALKVSKSSSQQQMIQGRLTQIQQIVDARKGQEAAGVVTVQGAVDAPQNSRQMIVLPADADGNQSTASKPQPSSPATASPTLSHRNQRCV